MDAEKEHSFGGDRSGLQQTGIRDSTVVKSPEVAQAMKLRVGGIQDVMHRNIPREKCVRK